jgi:hypothetical protein
MARRDRGDEWSLKHIAKAVRHPSLQQNTSNGTHSRSEASHITGMKRYARSIRSSVVGFFSGERSQKVIQHKVCYFAAQPLTGGQVKTEMLPTENTT